MKLLIDNRHTHRLVTDFKGIALFVGAIWLIFALDRLLPLEQLGLIPRSLRGLTGVVAMPFLHADFTHLLSNTIPLLITLALLAGSSANSAAIVTMVALLAGVLLWLFGRSALHIGASALVYGLIAFHVFAGVFEKRFTSTVIAVAVGLLYSTTFLKGILPFQQGVSWEGHLFGAVAGALVALGVSRRLHASAPIRG